MCYGSGISAVSAAASSTTDYSGTTLTNTNYLNPTSMINYSGAKPTTTNTVYDDNEDNEDNEDHKGCCTCDCCCWCVVM
jgi:hypothetical protein